MLAMKDTTASAQVPSRVRVQERDQRVQQQAVWVGLANKVSMAVCIVIAFSAAWVICAKGAQIYSQNYQNVNMQTQIQKLSAENASLTSQVDQLESPSRILHMASQLGMQYANPVQIGANTSGK